MNKYWVFAGGLLLLQGCVNTAVQIGCIPDATVEKVPAVKSAKFSVQFVYREHSGDIVRHDRVACEHKDRACDGRGLHNAWDLSFESGTKNIVIKSLGIEGHIEQPVGSYQKLIAGDYPKEKANLVTQKDSWTKASMFKPETLLTNYGIEISDFIVKKTLQQCRQQGHIFCSRCSLHMHLLRLALYKRANI